MTSDSLLRINLFTKTFSSFPTYKLLAEWLGVYTYIPPAHRVLHPVSQTIPTSKAAFLCWEYQVHAESCLTLEEQVESWKLLTSQSTREF